MEVLEKRMWTKEKLERLTRDKSKPEAGKTDSLADLHIYRTALSQVINKVNYTNI